MEVYNANRVPNIILISFSVILWFVGLSYGSGIGKAYNIYEKTMILVILVSILFFLHRKTFYALSRENVFLFLTVFLFEFVSYFRTGQMHLQYLWLYLIVYIYSVCSVTKKDLKIIGFLYGILGGGVLMIANYTPLLSGWDGNSISMIGFFSYTVFCAGVLDRDRGKGMFLFGVYTIYYFYLLDTLDSRSSILFSIILIISVLGIIPLRSLLLRKRVWILLLFPLIAALFIVNIKDMRFVEGLNLWSYQTFQKPIFNGRDELWYNALMILSEYPLLGDGYLRGNWHNSAMAALAGTGLIGYGAWVCFIRKCWIKCCECVGDFKVFSFVAAFIIIWLQQSVELGIFQERGNPVIFVVLGLGLARVNTITQETITEC